MFVTILFGLSLLQAKPPVDHTTHTNQVVIVSSAKDGVDLLPKVHFSTYGAVVLVQWRGGPDIQSILNSKADERTLKDYQDKYGVSFQERLMRIHAGGVPAMPIGVNYSIVSDIRSVSKGKVDTDSILAGEEPSGLADILKRLKGNKPILFLAPFRSREDLDRLVKYLKAVGITSKTVIND